MTDQQNPFTEVSYVFNGVDCKELWDEGKTPTQGDIDAYVELMEEGSNPEEESAPDEPTVVDEPADMSPETVEKITTLDEAKTGSLADKLEWKESAGAKATFCGYCPSHGHAIYSYRGKDYHRKDIPANVMVEPIVEL